MIRRKIYDRLAKRVRGEEERLEQVVWFHVRDNQGGRIE
jgi:hypothetical protein